MADRAIVQEVTQLGVESLAAPGTPVAANRLMQAMHFALDPDAEIDVYGPMGQKYDTLTVLNKEWSKFDISGKPTYTEMLYFLAGLITDPVTTTPGGGTVSRQHVFTPQPSAPDAIRTFTIEQGVPGGTAAERAAYGIIREGRLAFNRNGGNDLSGAGIAQRATYDVPLSGNEVQQVAITGGPTGGTFTLTFGGQTTAPIAYNASASVVQAALELLSSIGTGGVVATGGPLPGTPVLVEFRGVNAQKDVAAMTASSAGLTGGTTPTVVITSPTPGVPPTAIALVPISPTEVSVYLDDTYAGLGTTKLLRDFAVEWSLGGRENPIFPLNAALSSYAGIVEAKPTTEVKLTMGNDAAGRALLATMRTGAFKYMRMEAVGPLIEGSINYLFRLDVALKITAAPGRGDLDGLSTLEWTGRPMYDATSGLSYRATLINTLTSL